LKLLVVVPAFNEAATLPCVVADVRAALPGASIVVVDDASTDATGDVVGQLGVRWLTLPIHLGAGAAVRVALRWGRELGFDIAVRLDGDGQHRASDAPAMLAMLGAADAVQASRYAGLAHVPRRTTHRLLATLVSRLGRAPVTDPTSGFWAFGPEAMRLCAEHHPSGYGEPELRLLLSRNGLRVAELAVEMRPRLAGRTSLRGARLAGALAHVLLGTLAAPFRPSLDGTA
jgi:glycosyltransferase involved in cell wall biosynthesis